MNRLAGGQEEQPCEVNNSTTWVGLAAGSLASAVVEIVAATVAAKTRK